MATKKKQAAKKKKTWYRILSSKEFNNSIMGETTTNDESKLIGRSICTNLSNLTRDMKMQNIKIRFRINEIKENNAHTEIVGYNLIPTYIKRVVKVSKNRVDDSFTCKTKDNVEIRIKPFLITKNKTKRSTLTDLRKKTREYFNKICSEEDYNKVINDLISHKIQKDLRSLLKKVYPLNVVEVRSMTKT